MKYPPWQTLTKDNQGKIIGSSGLIFEVLDQISHKLNFSYSVREPADGLWGAQEGGTWNGMIKQVVDKEVMLAADACANSYERMQVVNFTSALDLQPYASMYRRPKEVSLAVLFVDPFTPTVFYFQTMKFSILDRHYRADILHHPPELPLLQELRQGQQLWPVQADQLRVVLLRRHPTAGRHQAA